MYILVINTAGLQQMLAPRGAIATRGGARQINRYFLLDFKSKNKHDKRYN